MRGLEFGQLSSMTATGGCRLGPATSSTCRWVGCTDSARNGFPDKGRCAAGGGHEAAGFDFALRFVGNLEDDVELVPAED